MEKNQSLEFDIDSLFTKRRTCYYFSDKQVSDELLIEIYNVIKCGPTSANGMPLRISFLKSQNSKEKLLSCLAPGNIDKTVTAPVTAIFAYDVEFYSNLDKLAPHGIAMKKIFEGNAQLAQETAFRNSSLQAAYFMLIARAKGLDCGPMSGFNEAKLNSMFFSETQNIKVNFICNLGYSKPDSNHHPMAYRLTFEESCNFI